MRKESEFQHSLILKIKDRFPGCIVMKNDASYIQGIPDLTILYGSKWATLECKQHAKAKHRPNQDFYVKKLNDMSYSAFVYPENEEEVLYGLEQAFAD